MENLSRKMIRIIVDRLKNYQLLADAKTTFKQTAVKAQEKLAYAQSAAAQKYDTIVKQVNEDTIIQDVNAPPLQLQNPLPKKLMIWWQWYQQLTGLDNVEGAKRQVILVQDKLFNCQEKRRKLTQHVTTINNNLARIYAELVQTKREDPKYVQLTIIENKSLQESKKINEELSLLEKEEKDHFMQLATAIKEYHDSQTMNAQKYKYLSILASALFAIVSVIGSMIYNNKRIKDVRNVIDKAQQTNQKIFSSSFACLQDHLNSKFEEISQLLNTGNVNKTAQWSKRTGSMPFNNSDPEQSSVVVTLSCVIGAALCIYIIKSIFG